MLGDYSLIKRNEYLFEKGFRKRKHPATLGNGKQLRFDNILFHKDGLVFIWLGSIVFDFWEKETRLVLFF